MHPSEPVECYGKAAAALTSAAFDGERVVLELDVVREDRFGRTLAYLWKDGNLFNGNMVFKGYAVVSAVPRNVNAFSVPGRLTIAEGVYPHLDRCRERLRARPRRFKIVDSVEGAPPDGVLMTLGRSDWESQPHRSRAAGLHLPADRELHTSRLYGYEATRPRAGPFLGWAPPLETCAPISARRSSFRSTARSSERMEPPSATRVGSPPVSLQLGDSTL